MAMASVKMAASVVLVRAEKRMATAPTTRSWTPSMQMAPSRLRSSGREEPASTASTAAMTRAMAARLRRSDAESPR